MKFISSLVFCCCFLLAGSLLAQNPADRVKRRAENRAEQNVNNRVDRTVDKAVDDVIGSIFGKKKTKPANENTQNQDSDNTPDGEEDTFAAASAVLAELMGGKWEPYTNPRSFSFSLEMVTTKANGERKVYLIDYAITETKVGFRMFGESETEETRMILDTQSGKTTMVTTNEKGKKEGVRMRIPNMNNTTQSTVDEIAEDYSHRIKINRTGERKNIEGYSCEKYIITDTQENSTTTAWVTNSLDLSMEDMLKVLTGVVGGGMVKMPDIKHQPKGAFDGLLIQAIVEDEKGEVSQVTYKNIKTDAAADQQILDIRGIPIQDTGF